MRETIYDRSNRVIGYINETSTQIQAFNAHNCLIGYYSKSANVTYKNGNYFGRGDQTMRLLS